MSTTVTRPAAINIEPKIKKRVKRLADARRRTPHRLMREAILQYVEREEKREAFHQDAFAGMTVVWRFLNSFHISLNRTHLPRARSIFPRHWNKSPP